MTIETMEHIFKMNIPLEGIVIDSGIYEFYTDGNKSIGISYESIEEQSVYIFNIFIDDEYVNIGGEYESIYDAVEIVTQEWNKMMY